MKTDKPEINEYVSSLELDNIFYLESLYKKYVHDSSSVSSNWRMFFESFDVKVENSDDETLSSTAKSEQPSWQHPRWPIIQNSCDIDLLGDYSIRENSSSQTKNAQEKKIQTKNKDNQNIRDKIGVPEEEADKIAAHKQMLKETLAIETLIKNYRRDGHFNAQLDPLALRETTKHPELSYRFYGFTEADLDRHFYVNGIFGLEHTTLRNLITLLEKAYCTTIAVQFSHVAPLEVRQWIKERMENMGASGGQLAKETRLTILDWLVAAEGFAKFCNVKFTGMKRFGIEGAESIIPALNIVVESLAYRGVKEVTLGMAHRGRLNVSVNLLDKPYRAVFYECKGGSSSQLNIGSSDVRYHLGASITKKYGDHDIHISLAPNPSHLEIVDPVVLGKARAKQTQHKDTNRHLVVPILIHGDASFPGQGVVAECFELSQLDGYTVGGSIHFIINNQIGFTTNPVQGRSSPYPSDPAKAITAPIFHVNGDDPEAVVRACQMAVKIRQTFRIPVVIDMFCYRRHGHNEADEPMFTQPLMYKKIKKHPTTLDIYTERLIRDDVVTKEQVESKKRIFRENMDNEFSESDSFSPKHADWLQAKWKQIEPYSPETMKLMADTGVSKELLKDIGRKISVIPETFHPHKGIERFMRARANMIEAEKSIDWATAEALAFGSLVYEGLGVRLSGQDSQRGTFSQRHAVLNDQEEYGNLYTPINSINECDKEKKFEVVNSMLSEMAVLGFEYGYSLSEPNTLVLWEAQFGDFANGAQVIIDQFIAGGELKWLRMSGLVLLLPHGYEGQGPEHSSARLERYLQMCAENNIQVAYCSTPANYFHILRRQLKRPFRKPLVLMTPKSLLRHKRCVSHLTHFLPKHYFSATINDDAERLIDQKIALAEDRKIRRLILCSGKVYYDLYEAREEKNINDIYILRVEQIYPFPSGRVHEAFKRFPNAEIIWCQEEPKNMGAWSFISEILYKELKSSNKKQQYPRYIGRDAMAATAAGLARRHKQELESFLKEAML